MGISLQIILNQPNIAFRPGAFVDGRVLVSNNGREPVEINGLDIWFHGEEFVAWQVHNFMCTMIETKSYTDGWKTTPQEFRPLEKGFVEVGETSFLFRFQLPVDCPSSYRSNRLDGHVMYQVQAKLETTSSFSVSKRAMLEILVLGYLILPMITQAEPLQAELERNNGGRGVRVIIPQRGWVPGDLIPFTVHAYQDKPFMWSPKVVLCVKEFLRTRAWHHSKAKTEYIAEVRKERAVPQEKKTNFAWEGEIRIPVDVELTCLGGAKFIELNYNLKVSGSGIDTIEIPIVVGTGFFYQQASSCEP